MPSNLMHYTCCLIVITVFIDQGDGRWKRKDKKENLQHDIEVFRKMADKVEQEIEAFYDEYPDERLRGDHVDRIHHKYEQKTLGRKSFTESGSESGVKLYSQSDFDNSSRVLATDITKPIVTNEIDSNIHVSFKANSINNSNNESMSSSNWPKFDDILLEMGKQYDWKNDRWIKVKEKIRESRPRKVIEDKNNVEFHERHKFSYKIVKLNRSKSRKNVVVAVSAVR